MSVFSATEAGVPCQTGPAVVLAVRGKTPSPFQCLPDVFGDPPAFKCTEVVHARLSDQITGGEDVGNGGHHLLIDDRGQRHRILTDRRRIDQDGIRPELAGHHQQIPVDPAALAADAIS
jgi:hypothetical protein